jgi:hypothetical protein
MAERGEEGYYHQVEDPAYRYLKQFQCDRLWNTYEDFIARPRYESACRFFFDRLYSTEDTHERDEAFLKIYDTARRYLGGEVVDSMSKLIDLQKLTLVLDSKILEVMRSKDMPFDFDMVQYELAYRLSDNYDDRVEQVELLDFTMRLVHSISHRLGIGLVLKGLKAASFLTGDTRMVDFLQDGYYAFKDIPDIGELATNMWDREMHRLDRIYGRIEESLELPLPP